MAAAGIILATGCNAAAYPYNTMTTMTIVTISQRGQIVIPKQIRSKLDLVKARKLLVDFSEQEGTTTRRPVGATGAYAVF